MEERNAIVERAREFEYSLLAHSPIELAPAKACADLGDIYREGACWETAAKYHGMAGDKYSQSADSAFTAGANYLKALDSNLKTNGEGSKLYCLKTLRLISAMKVVVAPHLSIAEAHSLCLNLSEILQSHATVRSCSSEISAAAAAAAATTVTTTVTTDSSGEDLRLCYNTCVLQAAVFLSAKGCYTECYSLLDELAVNRPILTMDIALYIPFVLSAVLSGNITVATNLFQGKLNVDAGELFTDRVLIEEIERTVNNFLDGRAALCLDGLLPIMQSNRWIDLLFKKLEVHSFKRAQVLQGENESAADRTPIKKKMLVTSASTVAGLTALSSNSSSSENSATSSSTTSFIAAAAAADRPTSMLPVYVRAIRRRKDAGFGLVIENVLTSEECHQWILDTENSAEGYEEALVNIGYGRQKKMLDVRNSSRCIMDDAQRAAELWQRIKAYVPTELKYNEETWTALELNERLRFLRYDKGEYFRPHSDGAYVRHNNDESGKRGDRSMVTFQLYLNEDCFGGTTRFFGDGVEDMYDVVPKAGSVLLFEHPLLHSGEEVTAGRKYAMRTDVMYTKASKKS